MQWLEVKPTDDEKTIARKKKLLKSYKSKKRFQEMDVKQKERQSNWQSFLKGKGSKSKAGEIQMILDTLHQLCMQFYRGSAKAGCLTVCEWGPLWQC